MIFERTKRSGQYRPCHFLAEGKDFEGCAKEHLCRDRAIASTTDVEMSDRVVFRVVRGMEVFEEGCDGVAEVEVVGNVLWAAAAGAVAGEGRCYVVGVGGLDGLGEGGVGRGADAEVAGEEEDDDGGRRVTGGGVVELAVVWEGEGVFEVFGVVSFSRGHCEVCGAHTRLEIDA